MTMKTKNQILILGIVCLIAGIVAFLTNDLCGGYLLNFSAFFCFGYFFYKTFVKRDEDE